jgi:hypothetical protein
MNKRTTVFLVIVAFFISGCSTPVKKAIYIDPAFQEQIGAKLYILPTIDRRKDKSETLNLDKDIRKPVAAGLKKKGYDVELLNNFEVKESIPAAAIAEMSQDELFALGPQQASSVMVLYLDDASSKYTVIGFTFKIELMGLLLDKQRKTVLWKDKGVGTSGQGGLISGLVAPMVKSGALSSSVNSMLMSFPKKAKAAK